MVQTVVGVRFKKAGKIYYFSPGKLDIQKGDAVIVETARGVEYGTAVLGPREVSDESVSQPVKPIQRKATEADTARVQANKEKEKEAFAICEKKIAEHELSMKLVDVEYTFDFNKIIFYFTADGRIDFRDLVKDLAAVFRTRIELRQIGVRDEAKLMGGLGGCGRPLCCASFLGDFEPVSIRMAKEQNLSLNPTKISGICGRLMCCLKYENDCYCERFPKKEKVKPPTQGNRVVTVEGEGRVISVNMQRRSATILLDDSKTVVASWEDVVEKEEQPSEEYVPETSPAAEEAPETENSDNEQGAKPLSRRERPSREHGPRKNRNVSRKNGGEAAEPRADGENGGRSRRQEAPRSADAREHKPRGERRHRPPRREGQKTDHSGSRRRENREHAPGKNAPSDGNSDGSGEKK